MKKRTTLLLVVVVALSLPLASTASAEEIAGTGTIWAKGAGLAVLRGATEIEIEAHGVGVVWVKDAERLEASGRGHRWEVPGSNATVFWGWSGTILTSGDRMTVWMMGGVIEFTASGTARFICEVAEGMRSTATRVYGARAQRSCDWTRRSTRNSSSTL